MKTEKKKFILLANSIPKSGTYLLQSLLAALPGYRDAYHHLLDGHCDFNDPNGFYRMSKTTSYMDLLEESSEGDVYPAHLKATDENIRYFQEKNYEIKMVFIYRHPLDILISHANYYARLDSARKDCFNEKIQLFRNKILNDDSTSLYYDLYYNRNFFDYLKFYKWLEQPNVLSIRFEDLYNALLKPKGNGLIDDILLFLNMDKTKVHAEDLWGKIAHTGMTSSGNVKKIDRYVDMMKDEHWGLALETDLYEIAKKFDYDLNGFSGKLCLFGGGSGCVKALRDVFEVEQITCIYDNDPSKHGGSVCDIPVRSPEDIDPTSGDHYVITSERYVDISSQLYSKGIPAEFIHTWSGLSRNV